MLTISRAGGGIASEISIEMIRIAESRKHETCGGFHGKGVRLGSEAVVLVRENKASIQGEIQTISADQIFENLLSFILGKNTASVIRSVSIPVLFGGLLEKGFVKRRDVPPRNLASPSLSGNVRLGFGEWRIGMVLQKFIGTFGRAVVREIRGIDSFGSEIPDDFGDEMDEDVVGRGFGTIEEFGVVITKSSADQGVADPLIRKRFEDFVSSHSGHVGGRIDRGTTRRVLKNRDTSLLRGSLRVVLRPGRRGGTGCRIAGA